MQLVSEPLFLIEIFPLQIKNNVKNVSDASLIHFDSYESNPQESSDSKMFQTILITVLVYLNDKTVSEKL